MAEISEDVKKLGSFESEDGNDIPGIDDFKFPFLTLRSCPSAITTCWKYLDFVITDLEWSVAYMKFTLSLGQIVTEPDRQNTSRGRFMDSTMRQLNALIAIAARFIQAPLPQLVDTNFRSLTKIYRLLTSLLKFVRLRLCKLFYS
jgi:hypothetical protein